MSCVFGREIKWRIFFLGGNFNWLSDQKFLLLVPIGAELLDNGPLQVFAIFIWNHYIDLQCSVFHSKMKMTTTINENND